MVNKNRCKWVPAHNPYCGKCVSTSLPSKTAGTIMWKSVLVPLHSVGRRSHINTIVMLVVPLNMDSKWFLQIVAVKLIHHIEKCASTCLREAGEAIIMLFRMVLLQCFYVLEPLCWCLHKGKMCWYPTFARSVKPYKCHLDSHGAIIMLIRMVLTNCCYQTDPSYRKV